MLSARDADMLSAADETTDARLPPMNIAHQHNDISYNIDALRVRMPTWRYELSAKPPFNTAFEMLTPSDRRQPPSRLRLHARAPRMALCRLCRSGLSAGLEYF